MSIQILKKIAIVMILVTVSVVSITVITPWYTNVTTHKETVEQIDAEISKVMALTAGAAGASAVISLLPDDSCTPIANELAEFSKYFLIVLSALYLEKYLITVLGYFVFTFIIPIACVIFGIWFFVRKAFLKSIAVKLLVGAAVLTLLIPASTKISSLIQNSYDNSIEETIQEANRITVAEDEGDSSWLDKFTNWISNAAVTLSEYVTDLLSRFVEALAVMLVTSCIIPILVIVIFVWVAKVLFGVKVVGSELGEKK